MKTGLQTEPRAASRRARADAAERARGKVRRVALVSLTVALLAGTSQVQKALNADRDRLGLTRVAPLENAPPVLAFTTVALGGFRGLIANALWMRATHLQDEGKYFEMVQLADWITKLEPHYVQVWLVQAWNMAYNISVKFKDAPDRWRWVQRGIELLRDHGLRYNPNEILIYRELGWFFQHKMGHNLDDAHLYYKTAWRDEMSEIFKGPRPDFDELIHPQTDDAKERARLLRERYKLDPAFMKEVDQRYGPLEWRLPESHAIYWAAMGLDRAAKQERRIDKEELITLRRMIYQSMQLSFQRGRLVSNPISMEIDFGPNLDIIPNVSAAYEQAMEEDERNRDHISRAHRNFLRDAIYFLYTHNRQREAAEWFRHLTRKFPDEPLITGDPNSLPRNLTLDDYAIARVEEEVGDPGRDRVRAILEGLVATSFFNLAIGEDERAAAFDGLARKAWAHYQSRIEGDPEIRVKIPPMREIRREILDRMLDPERGLPPELANVLRTKLNLPPPTSAPPARVPGQ